MFSTSKYSLCATDSQNQSTSRSAFGRLSSTDARAVASSSSALDPMRTSSSAPESRPNAERLVDWFCESVAQSDYLNVLNTR